MIIKKLYKFAEKFLIEILNFRKVNLLPNDPDIGISMINLAIILQSQNNLKKSEELFRETLSFRELNLLPNHPDIGNSMNYLASVLESLNQLK